MQNDNNFIYGRNAVIEALNSNRPIEKVFIAFGTQGDNIKRIYSLAKKNKISIATVDKRKFGKLEMTSGIQQGKSQGVLALTRNFETLPIDEFISKTFEKSEKPVIVILDEIEDPQNLGAIARTVECSGADGIITTLKNSAPISPAAIKASAGALEIINIAKVDSIVQTIEKLKKAGFWIFGTDMEADKNYTDTFYDTPIALIIGSEGKGIRPSTRKHCDVLIKIPILGTLNSLNASVSAAIILYEMVRQRSNAIH